MLLVVTSGDEEAARALRAVAPANVRVEAFVPYDALMDRLDVLITNGGYGGVQFALAHGVPLIVAGDTEQKPEIAARVAWTGAGINLRIGTPTANAVGVAVDAVINDDSYRRGPLTGQRDVALLVSERDRGSCPGCSWPPTSFDDACRLTE